MAKQVDDIQKAEQTLIIEGKLRRLKPTALYMAQKLATLSENGKDLVVIEAGSNGDYIYTFEGQKYALSFMSLAQDFLKRMRKAKK